MAEKEFKVNDYITLKLERSDTNIYVAGSRAYLPKYLLLEPSPEKKKKFDIIESIDEVVETLDKTLNTPDDVILTGVISTEMEFWGHCSNIHTWVEHDYDTRLLHRKLAFPLLKRLVKAGDTLAMSVFKNEIAKRLSDKFFPVVSYIIENNYLSEFTTEELRTVIDKIDHDHFKGLRYYYLFPLLDRLIQAGDVFAKEILKSELAIRIEKEEEDLQLYLVLLSRVYHPYFTESEFEELLETGNARLFKKVGSRQLFVLLLRLIEAGNPLARKALKDEIILRCKEEASVEYYNLLFSDLYPVRHLDDAERACLFEIIDHEKIRNTRFISALHLLASMFQAGDGIARRVLREFIIHHIMERNHLEIGIMQIQGWIRFISKNPPKYPHVSPDPKLIELLQWGIRKEAPAIFFEEIDKLMKYHDKVKIGVLDNAPEEFYVNLLKET